jgi:hypothetical protein
MHQKQEAIRINYKLNPLFARVDQLRKQRNKLVSDFQRHPERYDRMVLQEALDKSQESVTIAIDITADIMKFKDILFIFGFSYLKDRFWAFVDLYGVYIDAYVAKLEYFKVYARSGMSDRVGTQIKYMLDELDRHVKEFREVRALWILFIESVAMRYNAGPIGAYYEKYAKLSSKTTAVESDDQLDTISVITAQLSEEAKGFVMHLSDIEINVQLAREKQGISTEQRAVYDELKSQIIKQKNGWAAVFDELSQGRLPEEQVMQDLFEANENLLSRVEELGLVKNDAQDS